MVSTGIISSNIKFPYPEYHMTFWDMIIYSDALYWSDISSIFDPI